MNTTSVNIHQRERTASIMLGGIVLFRGLLRRSLSGNVLGAVLLYRGISGHSYLYKAVGINTAKGNKFPEQERSITIGKSADDLYTFWRDPQNFSKIMEGFAEVTEESEGRMHWQMHSPLGKTIEWETQIVEDRAGELLSWKSVTGAQMPNEGSVHFHPAPRDWGTEVTLRFRFDPPGGTLGNIVAKSLRIVPNMLAEKALRNFKSLAETGEIPTLEHNSSARVHVGAY